MRIERVTVVEGEDDVMLVERARTDPAAFETLYLRYRDRVDRYLRSRTQHKEDAADLTQQVFLRALDRLAQYQPRKGTFAAWLFGIARHAVSDFHRHRRSQSTSADAFAALPLISDEDVEATAVRREDVRRLRRLLADLPVEKQELLALRFAADLTIVEIATIVGKSAEATRKQLTRTIQHLEEQYHEQPD